MVEGLKIRGGDCMTNNRNRLNESTSPYLLQHKDNPVWWWEWCDAAFAHARELDRPVFLSVGYSTCYWCHVMEHDSFERDDVAALLNGSFVAIKLDREERPDIDQVYMDAVVAITGHGGWPMSVFLTPDRRPFWGGTFFPRAQFSEILRAVERLWREEREKVLRTSVALTEAVSSNGPLPELVAPIGDREVDYGRYLESAVTQFSNNFDEAHGGFGAAPKFPPAVQIQLLLRMRSDDRPRVERMATKTLDAMMNGGLYDHVGGGFHRYATDAEWTVPHFEKMLYDNALLANTYLDAYQCLFEPKYGRVARETLEYLMRDMRSSAGGFYSAEDAGEVGREGEFYVWREEDFQKSLSEDDLMALRKGTSVGQSPNFEGGKYIITRTDGSDQRAWEQLRQKLFNARSKRSRPRRDEKIICAWNALAIRALARAAVVLGDDTFLKVATETAVCLRDLLWDGSTLRRIYSGKTSSQPACHDDYAYFVDALIELYQASFDEQWLMFAKRLQIVQDEEFWDNGTGGYYYSVAPDVLFRRKELHDQATPASNGVAYDNLIRLYAFFGETEFDARRAALEKIYASSWERHAFVCPSALLGAYMLAAGFKQVVVAGDNGADLTRVRELQRIFAPQAVFGQANADSEVTLLRDKPPAIAGPAIYLCQNMSCQLPTDSFESVAALLKSGSVNRRSS